MIKEQERREKMRNDGADEYVLKKQVTMTTVVWRAGPTERLLDSGPGFFPVGV